MMKKHLLISIVILMLACFPGCKNLSGQKDNIRDASINNCLMGKWIHAEKNFEKSFIFNEDKTGAEIYSATEIRPYTWKIKDGKPTIIYDGEKKEWSFILNCEKGELSVFGLPYKKAVKASETL